MNLAISVIFPAENLSHQAMQPMCYCLRKHLACVLQKHNYSFQWKWLLITPYPWIPSLPHYVLAEASPLSLVYYRKEKCLYLFMILHFIVVLYIYIYISFFFLLFSTACMALFKSRLGKTSLGFASFVSCSLDIVWFHTRNRFHLLTVTVPSQSMLATSLSILVNDCPFQNHF